MELGLSISPAHSPNPPNPPVPDPIQPDPTAPVVWRRSRSPKLDVSGLVSGPLLQKPFNPTHPKREQPAANSSFPTSFPARFGRFQRPKHQIWRFWARFGGKKHRIWRNLCQIRLDHIGSWTDRERSRRFSPLFGGFQWVSASPETDRSPDGKPTHKTQSPAVRLRVGHLPTRSPAGRLQVGHKPDPPDMWTALYGAKGLGKCRSAFDF